MRFGPLIVALVCGGVAPSADAAPPAPSPVDDSAREHYRLGQTAYQEGRYEDALAEFQAGYTVSARPEFLLDIAQTMGRLNRYDEAIAFFKRFLASAPDSPLAGEAKKRLSELEQRRAARVDTSTETKSDDQRKSLASAPPAATAKTPPQAAPRVESAARRRAVRNPAGWALVAGGVAAAGVGIGLFVHGEALFASASSAPTLPSQHDRQNGANAYDAAGLALIGVGAASVLGSVIVFVLARRAEHARLSAAHPGPPTVSGFIIPGSF